MDEFLVLLCLANMGILVGSLLLGAEHIASKSELLILPLETRSRIDLVCYLLGCRSRFSGASGLSFEVHGLLVFYGLLS